MDFRHGGGLEQHVKYGLSRINGEVAEWMNGEITAAELLRAC